MFWAPFLSQLWLRGVCLTGALYACEPGYVGWVVSFCDLLRVVEFGVLAFCCRFLGSVCESGWWSTLVFIVPDRPGYKLAGNSAAI